MISPPLWACPSRPAFVCRRLPRRAAIFPSRSRGPRRLRSVGLQSGCRRICPARLQTSFPGRGSRTETGRSRLAGCRGDGPRVPTLNSPCQTIIGLCFHRDFVPVRLGAGLWRKTAYKISWPSAKMSAVTVTRSPMMRLMGNRPQSTCGWTFSMTTRRELAGLMALFPSPVIARYRPPALSSRPLVKDRRGASEPVGVRKQ